MFTSLTGYQRSWLSGDLVAGLTVWAVLVPEALAYAGIAGVSPVVGLYAGAGRADLLRRVRFVEAPRRRADGGDGGAVGRRHGRHRGSQRWRRRATDHRPRDHHRVLRSGRRPRPAGLPRVVHLGAGAEGVHHRPRPHDHRGPAPAHLRRPGYRRRLLREGVGPDRQPGRDARLDPRRGNGVARARARPAPVRTARPGLVGGGGGRDRGRPAARARGQGRRDRRTDPVRAPLGGPPRRGLVRLHRPGQLRHRHPPGGVRRRARRGQDLRDEGALPDRPQPGADRPRCGQPRRRPQLRHGRGRLAVEDRRERIRGGPNPSRRASSSAVSRS